MSIFIQLTFFFWIIFIVYWLVSAIGVKKNVKDRPWWKSISFQVTILIMVVLLLRSPLFIHFFPSWKMHLFQSLWINNGKPSNVVLGSIGVILVATGVALAIWARVYLGRNWGMPMSIKEKPDLVTTGPYAYIRHPIYTGMLLAILGSAFVAGLLWIIVFVISCAYFLYSIKEEEKLMTKQFPKEYIEYKKRTKALIPFVF